MRFNDASDPSTGNNRITHSELLFITVWQPHDEYGKPWESFDGQLSVAISASPGCWVIRFPSRSLILSLSRSLALSSIMIFMSE